MSEWVKVICSNLKCGLPLPGEYKEGTEVRCKECGKWTEVMKGEKDGGSKVRSRKTKV